MEKISLQFGPPRHAVCVWVWLNNVYLELFAQASLFSCLCTSYLVFIQEEFLWPWGQVAYIAYCSRFEGGGWVPCSLWDPSSPVRDQTQVLCIAKQILNHWTGRDVPMPLFLACKTFLCTTEEGRKRKFQINYNTMPSCHPLQNASWFTTCQKVRKHVLELRKDDTYYATTKLYIFML